MKKFQKHFVGKGKQVEGLQIIKVTVNMDDLNNLSYQFNGETYEYQKKHMTSICNKSTKLMKKA